MESKIICDKLNLKESLKRFDDVLSNIVNEEEVFGNDNGDNLFIRNNTFFTQVILDALCATLSSNEDERDLLFNKLYEELKKLKVVDKQIELEPINKNRRQFADDFISYAKSIISNHQTEDDHRSEKKEVKNKNSSKTIETMRYEETFDVIECIGKGGFGSVDKVRHKESSKIFAVKKIPFIYENDHHYFKVHREVNSLSSLHHINIVQYHAAWLQRSVPSDWSNTTDSTDVADESSVSSSGSSCLKSLSSLNDECLLSNKSVVHLIQKVEIMLCIQMEFCDSDLLRWIENRNNDLSLPFEKSIEDMFLEILQGTDYLHDEGIIHRDLKPGNIFYSKASDCLKIGDFGLATSLKSSARFVADNESDDIHSKSLGTPPYAAPEQIHKKAYDQKVDLYSLGVILVELLFPSKTRMEFFCCIDNAKKIQLPPLPNIDMEHYRIIGNLLLEDPRNRMSAKEVLNCQLFSRTQQ